MVEVISDHDDGLLNVKVIEDDTIEGDDHWQLAHIDSVEIAQRGWRGDGSLCFALPSCDHCYED